MYVVYTYTGEESTSTNGDATEILKKVGMYVIKWIFSMII